MASGQPRARPVREGQQKRPCIVFIDELDAVGRERGAGLGRGNDEREQTLNQILDPALPRPGRFDRQITVDRPDRPGREAILRVHVRQVPLTTDVKLDVIAASTVGMVGADLANLVNEAALTAVRRNLDQVTQTCFEEAMDRILMGAERLLVLSKQERQVTAYHEGGHALVAQLTPEADPVQKVTIVTRGQSLGATKMVPLDDKHNYSRSYLLARLAVGLGGRVAEELAIGEITTRAENDLQEVTRLSREMVTHWGMSQRVGAVFLGGEQEVFLGREVGLRERQSYSEYSASLVDEEVQHLISERYSCVQQLLAAHREELEHIARALLEQESLNEPQLHRLLIDERQDGAMGSSAGVSSDELATLVGS